MTFTCREFAARLLEFVGDEMTPEQRRVIEQHICACPPCAVYIAQYRVTVMVARRLEPIALPGRLLERVRAALEADKPATD